MNEIPVDQSFLDQLVTLYKTGATAILVIPVLYALALYARKYLPILKKGRIAAISAAVVGVLAQLAPTALAGSWPSASAVLMALMAGVAMVMKPDGNDDPEVAPPPVN
jgi:hypothetical protein